jgi:hypothetical protein
MAAVRKVRLIRFIEVPREGVVGVEADFGGCRF